MRRRSLTALTGLTALVLTLSACMDVVPAETSLDRAPAAPAPQVVETEPAALPTEEPEPSAAPSTEPPASPTQAAPPPLPSYDVVAAQRTLSDLGYYLGAADGRRGSAFRSAVMAFQKVQGIGADGTVGPATLKALAAPRKPVLKEGPANRVEVDLTKQVLYVVKNGAVQRIMPVSSGNGATYKQKNGGKARALTPVGWYKVQRRIVGVREADLGTLYDPQYFYRGWAIHGSNSVPARPASHGCVRVTRADAKWLLSNISIGMSVHLYGGTHVFPAGSSAPGTDSPTGDTSGGTEPSTAPSPQPAASPAPASSRPAPAASPSPSPTAAEPSPAPAQPTPTAAAPSPTATAR